MRKTLAATVLAGSLGLAGCVTMDVNSAVGVGATAMKAMSLTDDEVVAMSNQSCEEMDAQNKVAPAKNKYTTRLNKVVAKMPKEIDGKKAVYKVYLTSDVNAWAMANGCIRVYSGLMDLMNDDELRGVLGHEIGHVALGHSKKRMQTAYAATAARQLAAQSSSATVAALTRSQAGDLAEKFLNAQFSQSQELDADGYSFDLLTSLKLERKGLVTGFQKLSKISGGDGSLLSSHPGSDDRAKRMQERLDAKK